MLRSHGYDHKTLEPLCGKPVEASTWAVGDVVSPKKLSSQVDADTGIVCSCVGRVVAEASTPGAPLSATAQSRDAGTVVVEFVGRDFAEAVGVKSSAVADAPPMLESKRVQTSKLVHTTLLYEVQAHDEPMDESPPEGEKSPQAPAPTESQRSEIAKVARFDRGAIEAISKECRKSSDAMASLFSAGLPAAVVSAIDVAERQMRSLEPQEDLSERITSLGSLAIAIGEQLYSTISVVRDESVEEETERAEAEPATSRQRPARGRGGELSQLQRMQEALARRMSRQDAPPDVQALLSSAQQRRSMLLTLMSRGRGGMNEPNRDLHLGQLPPQVRAPPIMFGGSVGAMQDPSWDDAPSLLLASRGGDEGLNNDSMSDQDSSPAAQPESVGNPTFLDTILRCRGEVSSVRLAASHKQGGAAYFAFIRSLIANGILVDSLSWVKALIDSHSKKVHVAPQPRSNVAIVREATDEDGTSLLKLAVSLGCSVKVLKYLIECGGIVGKDEVKKAAETDQPLVLAELLQHTSYCEGTVDPTRCSAGVIAVLERAKSRQEDLDRKMRETADSFMVQLLRKLLQLGLTCRQNRSPRQDICSKAVVEILIGNVLLDALQRAQKAAPPPTQAITDTDQDSTDRSGRFAVEESACNPKSSPGGLLRILPDSVLGAGLLGEKDHTTVFLLLVEDYLCSKDMCDTAAGLTFLAMFLNNFPNARSSPEMDRYGMAELVSFHDVLASNRVAEILSRKFAEGLQVSSAQSGSANNEPSRLGSTGVVPADCSSSVVLCPKKHTAVLHITRHSSFRCDLCGNGVDRGRPMHGCRECDWDACETCMDRAESGLVKCSAIKEVASECLRLLEASTSGSSKSALATADADGHALLHDDNVADLNMLSIRLLQRESGALKELAELLRQPGSISIHQFLSIILPALHAALVGRSGNESSPRRNKRARVLDGPEDVPSESPDLRLLFSRDAVQHLVLEDERENDVSPKAGKADGKTDMEIDGEENGDQDDGDQDDGDQENDETGELRSEGRSNSDLQISAGNAEVLRRLHQILALYENVPIFSSASKNGSTAAKGGDLHALTKPVEIHLAPSAFSSQHGSAPKNRLIVHAEPLIPLKDLELHVLRTHRLDDPAYVSFCRR